MTVQRNLRQWIAQASRAARPLEGRDSLDPLVDMAANRRMVLIGEMSHGTHESHVLRAQLTMRLIEELGFGAVFVEADRLEAAGFDQAVRLLAHAQDPAKVLERQTEWPSWMWSNTETAQFGQWLQNHNRQLRREERVGWYGLDYWPLWAATREVLTWIGQQHPGQVNAALDAPLRGHAMVGQADLGPVCEYVTHRLGIEPADDAAWYYRRVLTGGTMAMNARAKHWLDRVDLRSDHKKIVVWAHNTHIGDSDGVGINDGVVSFGHMVRQVYGPDQVLIVGFAGGGGHVVAAALRGAPMDVFEIPPPNPGSWEAVLTGATESDRALVIPNGQAWTHASLSQRAIGAVSDGSVDLSVPTEVGSRYDAILWSRRTSPVGAMHLEAARAGRMPTLRV